MDSIENTSRINRLEDRGGEAPDENNAPEYWVGRDFNGHTVLYRGEPILNHTEKSWLVCAMVTIRSDEYPQFSSLPICQKRKVKITIELES